ncbi:hypothetical protein GGR55DRAFT_252877 [Xylaria sp. FL0064]|nr:hypothetical protein GGR55DRAFT_252877 [Xylaria sp. FL0064]
MSFGFSVGDFIAGANLAHKLIRVMTETRGASIEYQEALAELCGIQQVFIQITQLSRNEILPKATLNSLAQIIMPSMAIIADFLDRTKHYQTKLSQGGGLSSSWCKVGWALYRKEELKLLHDTLHARLSAINALLAAASHFPSCHASTLPESVAQFQVSEESLEMTASNYHNSAHGVHASTVDRAPVSSQDPPPAKDVPLGLDPSPSSEMLVAEKMQLDGVNINGMSTISEIIQAASKARTPVPALQHDSNTLVSSNAINKNAQGPGRAGQDFDSYFQRLFEKAITIQAELEAKARMEQKLAEEAEERLRLEESIRLKAEADVREQIERARLDAERERDEERQKLAAEEAYQMQAFQDAKIKAEDFMRKSLGKDKAPIRFKDAVGRKFSFPFHICRTWQGMEDLINQAFLHVEVIGPHVQAGHYDLIGPNGEIILPQVWDKVIEPDWAITMHMWPMDKPKNLEVTAEPADLPIDPLSLSWAGKKKESIASFMGSRIRRIRRRRSSISSNSVSSSPSLLLDI